MALRVMAQITRYLWFRRRHAQSPDDAELLDALLTEAKALKDFTESDAEYSEMAWQLITQAFPEFA